MELVEIQRKKVPPEVAQQASAAQSDLMDVKRQLMSTSAFIYVQ